MDNPRLRAGLWLVALLCLVQGFGSVITDAVWHSTFGISGVLIGGLGAPAWTSWVIGGLGVAMVVWATTLRLRAGPAAHGRRR